MEYLIGVCINCSSILLCLLSFILQALDMNLEMGQLTFLVCCGTLPGADTLLEQVVHFYLGHVYITSGASDDCCWRNRQL